MRLTLSLLFAVLVPSLLVAQAPVANFTANVTTGCSPLTVQFTDKSTGSPKSWNWDLGNGTLANGPNPVATYNPGTYTVTLVVSNASGSDQITKTAYIIVNPSPTVNFSADKRLACLPATVQFTDLSTANAGTINTWEWHFNDGGPNVATQNPQHTYTTPGFYDVYLKVTSTTGCFTQYSIPRFMRIVSGVKADFSYTGPTTCSAPYNVAFQNLTSGPGNITYNWDLGNGSMTGQANPGTVYNTAGTYTVKLSAQSEFGCSDAVTKTVPISGITTSFSSPPDSACDGSPFTFTNTSSSTPTSVVWTFGDGTSSTQLKPPSKLYAGPGVYPVKLISNFGSCTDSVTRTIHVFDHPAVTFTANKVRTCKPPFTVTFQNTSPDAVNAQWDFGDGSTGTGNSPTHTYTKKGIDSVTLTITDSKGCRNTLKKEFIYVLDPFVVNDHGPSQVCVNQDYKPLSVISAAEGVATYTWDFGDGGAAYVENPTYQYTAPGVYKVKLTIVTNDGCPDSSTTTVKVGTKPFIDFSVSKATPCRSDIVSFTNLSTPINTPLNPVVWSFGDGTTSILQNPSHKFPDTGYYAIQLTVNNNGCVDSLSRSNFVRSLPPAANFGYTVDCANRNMVVFHDSSSNDLTYGPLTYKWNFGDPAATTSVVGPSVPFPYPVLSSPITYNATLIVQNLFCTDTIIKPVKLYNDSARFILDKNPAVYCRNDQVTFSALNDLNYVKVLNFVIDGMDHSSDQAGHYETYTTTGNHNVQLITTDVNGCLNYSRTIPFSITGPTAKFSIANKGGCSKSSVTFLDSSKSSGTITKWVYDFGDGVIKTFTAGPFIHTYADTGHYTVKLTVFDNTTNNCSDTFSLSGNAGAVITRPVPNFSVPQTLFCPGSPLQFKDSSFGKGLTYLWSFGDGSTDTAQNPLHTYPKTDTVYSVKLTVRDSVGCIDSLIKVKYITLKAPQPLFAVSNTVSFCPPVETKFSYKGLNAQSFEWDFGDGSSPSSLSNTSHFYNAYGKYTAKLYVTGYGGCLDSATIPINIPDPYAETKAVFNPANPSACNQITVDFTLTIPDSTSFYFYFGDGAYDTTQKLSLTHFYNLPNTYSPYIILADHSGCQVITGSFGTIQVLGALPLFGEDKNKFCDSGTVYFSDYSQQGSDAIVGKSWNFDDGTPPVSVPKDIVHTFTKPGLYAPALTVTSASGCVRTLTDTVRVLATPRPVINSTPAVCFSLSLDLMGTLLVPPDTATKWQWGYDGKTATQQNITVKFADTGVHHITLMATNSLGCKGDTSRDIVVNPLPVIKVTADTSIISGGLGLTLPLTYSPNVVSYSWAPDPTLSCTDCPNPFANPKFSTAYTVTVTDANGCVNTRTVKLIVACNNKNFYIPNTFSPNNDGANDRFYPRGTGLNSIRALRIFNRWGELIFEKRNFAANDASAGWDGTYKGKAASPDTYIYMIDIICDNATVITYKGDITLIR